MPNDVRHHEYLKCFFRIANPRIHPTPKIVQPNFKVDAFFENMRKFYLEAWDPSPCLTVDEQVQRFSSRWSRTRRCNFEREGDGLFIDALCNDGHTIACYPRNQPPPRKHTSIQCSPLHYRIMFLIDQLEKDP